MDLQQLRYAVALSRELHFRKASEKMNVTQPTLSQGIKKLEGELGSLLFERSPRGVKLTPAGKKFIPRAISILEEVGESIRELQEASGEAAGAVRVGSIPTICPYLMPQVITELRKTAPRLTIELREETTSLLVEHLKAGELDMGVLALPITEKGISSLSIRSEPFYLAVSKRHRLAGARRISPKEVARERVLILQEGHCFRNQSLEYCKLSPKDPHVIFQGGSLTSVLKLAASGEGVTFVPKMALDPKGNPGLAYIPFTPPEPEREIGVIWRVTSSLNLSQKAVLETVEKVLEQLY